MAEILGVTASGIAVFQLTVEIGKAIVKLKHVCDDVNEASDTLHVFLRKAEILKALLEALGPSFANPYGQVAKTGAEDVVSRGFLLCKEALQSLTDLVEPLATDIISVKKSRRIRGKINIALKKESMERCERRLQYAIDILQFAKQEYTLWVLELIDVTPANNIDRALLRDQLSAIEGQIQSNRSGILKPMVGDDLDQGDEVALSTRNSGLLEKQCKSLSCCIKCCYTN
jgi:hypothetical protein